MIEGNKAADRRWRFAAALFDEGNWTLTVAGERVTLENKPLRLLRELLHHPGQVVSKEALLDAVWPGVIVVEGSLTTAMNKLRRALGDGDSRIIETVPGIGYRLGVPVELAASSPPAASQLPETLAAPAGWPRWAAAAAAAAVLGVGAVIVVNTRAAPPPAIPVTQAEMFAAMRTLDLPALHSLVDRGWNPKAPIGTERNSAIATIVEICEWNPAHDRQKLVMAVRMLLDAGARATDRNVWGDTAYSIASAPRYCGPDHPATRMLKGVCTGSSPHIDPRCLADYAHSDWPQVTPPLKALARGS